ncbi:hypothetical protein RFI_14309 [Reticulomyxa filosa]|uniref:Uncharacterized protein n=1 Tax=Reticulomyxa filosa TaxID=46433 RepID=X6NAI3_RETFI|nr:hypothetical protein RFI_14309 [Reticulomyxa filosa]|eukprot:ETO22883.1 hypothetical protein RFI_14309 [Reticulomyxa filosa]
MSTQNLKDLPIPLFDSCLRALCSDDNNKDNDEITLLSFGGSKYSKKHTLVMNYVNKRKQRNQWIPFTNNQNNTICVGKNEDYYQGVRAMVGYYKNNISMFNLNTFQFIKHDTLSLMIGHAISKSKIGKDKIIKMDTNIFLVKILIKKTSLLQTKKEMKLYSSDISKYHFHLRKLVVVITLWLNQSKQEEIQTNIKNKIGWIHEFDKLVVKYVIIDYSILDDHQFIYPGSDDRTVRACGMLKTKKIELLGIQLMLAISKF